MTIARNRNGASSGSLPRVLWAAEALADALVAAKNFKAAKRDFQPIFHGDFTMTNGDLPTKKWWFTS